jgi:glycosyltransferase involved in cell wall biosynthesis
MNAAAKPLPPQVLAILPGFTPSTMMDVVNPLLQLERDGAIRFSVTLEFYSRLFAVSHPDLIVFCRNTNPRTTRLVEAIEQQHIPYIYDLDDDLFEISLDTALGQFHRAPQRLDFLTHYLQHAALVRVYSRPLFERVKPLTPSVNLVTPPLDWNLVAPGGPPTQAGPVKIVYATSRHQDPLFKIFLPALQQILEEYAGQIQMNFLGELPEPLRHHPNIHHIPYESSYNAYLRKFSRQGYEIGLAPLPDDEFHRSKTNNKFREYAACSIAGIYSNVAIYADCVQPGKTGLLVENTTQDWYKAIKLLIEDAALRRKIGQTAKEYAQAEYSAEKFRATWLEQIQAVSSARVNAEISSAPGPTQPESLSASASGTFWLREKTVLLWQRLTVDGLKGVWNTIRLQATNLGMLFKINFLRKP